VDPYSAVEVIEDALRKLDLEFAPFYQCLRVPAQLCSNDPFLPPEPLPFWDLAESSVREYVAGLARPHLSNAVRVLPPWFMITDHDKRHHTAFRLLHALNDPLLKLFKLSRSDDPTPESIRELLQGVHDMEIDSRLGFPSYCLAVTAGPDCRLRIERSPSANWCHFDGQACPIANDELAEAISDLIALGPGGEICLSDYCHSRELNNLHPHFRPLILTKRGRPTRLSPEVWR
jgi:hypothetical protein